MNRLLAINISDFGTSIGLNFGDWHDLDTLLGTKVAGLIDWITGLSALVAVIFLIVAGYTYITSTGEPEKVESAGKIITGSVIGLIIIFIARILIDFVLNLVMGSGAGG